MFVNSLALFQAEDDFKVIAVLQEQALEAARGVNPDPPLNPINSGSGAGNVNINMALNNPLQHNPTFPRQGKGGGGGVLLGSKGTAAVAASSGSATRGGRKPLKLSSGLAQTYPAAVITSKSSKEDVSRMVCLLVSVFFLSLALVLSVMYIYIYICGDTTRAV